MKISEISSFISDIFYPRRCVFCARILNSFGDSGICPKCANKKIEPKTVVDDKRFFDRATGILKYEGETRNSMIKYKFKSIKYYGKVFAKLTYDNMPDRSIFKDSIICPTPISRSRNRAYNQSEIIASYIASRETTARFIPDLLYKANDISQISKMDIISKKLLIEDSFGVNPFYDIFGQNIVVIDDIYTTGTTSDECAKMLKLSGAHKVYIVCACYD